MRRAQLVGSSVLVLCALGLLFFALFEPVDVEVEKAREGPAARDPWWAFAQVLEGLGISIQARYGLGQLPPADAVIVVLTEDPAARRTLWPRLGRWVGEGGHLLLAAPSGWEAEDTGGIVPGVTDPLVDLHLWTEPCAEWVSSGTSILHSSGKVRVLEGMTPCLAEGLQALEIWEGLGQPWGGRFAFGAGEIVAVGSLDFLENDQLGQGDHALLAWDLLQVEGGPPSEVLLVRSGEGRGLASLLIRFAGPLAFSLLVLGLVGAWRGAIRSGPVLPDPSPVRRDLMEHVRASGDLLWGAGLQAALLGPARAAVRRRLGSLGVELDDEAVVAALVDRGLDPLTARVAMIDPARGPDSFLLAMRTLQSLWSSR